MDKKVPTDGVVNGLLRYLKRQIINDYFAEWGIMRYCRFNNWRSLHQALCEGEAMWPRGVHQ